MTDDERLDTKNESLGRYKVESSPVVRDSSSVVRHPFYTAWHLPPTRIGFHGHGLRQGPAACR